MNNGEHGRIEGECVSPTTSTMTEREVLAALAELANVCNRHDDMADLMLDLAKKQTGFLGIESAREEIGITVSYWRDHESIRAWKMNVDHLSAQKLGKEKWYASYKTGICKVERDYGMEN